MFFNKMTELIHRPVFFLFFLNPEVFLRAFKSQEVFMTVSSH